MMQVDTGYNHHVAGSGLLVRKLVRNIWHRAYIVVAMFIVGLVLSHNLLQLITPRYASYVSLLIDPKRPGSLGADASFADVYVDGNKIAGVEQVITSSGLLSKVVAAQHLASDPAFGGPMPSRLAALARSLPGPLGRFVESLRGPDLPDTPERREVRALDRLERSVRTARVGMTYVIVVEVTADDPERARTLAQAVVDAYLTEQVELKYDAASRDATWLKARLDQLRSDVLVSEKTVEDIRNRYGLTQTDRASGATVGQQSITEINTELAKAEGEIAARQAKYEEAVHIRASGGNLDSLSDGGSSRLFETLREQEVALDRTIADLETHYTPSYPPLARAKADRAVLNRQIGAEVSRIIAGLRSDANAAVLHRDALRRQLNELVGSATAVQSEEGRVRLRAAESVAQANRAMYDATLTRLREVEQQQTREDVEGRVISGPTATGIPISPKPAIFYGLGGMLGLCGGLGIAALLGLSERRVVSAKELENALAMPVLCAVPKLGRRDLSLSGSVSPVHDYLVANPLSRFAESLRFLRCHLPSGRDKGACVIQVTSAVSGEGKTTISRALGLSFASAGLRTVVVDLDLYKTDDHDQHELEADTVLDASEPCFEQQWFDIPLLRLISARPFVQTPDMVGGQEFRRLMAKLRERFDVVIMDTPPVLAVAHPVTTSKFADITLMTAAWGYTQRQDIAQAVDMLRSVDAPLVGIVLNKAHLAKMGRQDRMKYYYDPAQNYYQVPRASKALPVARHVV